MRFPKLLLIVSGLIAGCGESHNPGEDAAIVFDANFPDTGFDAGPPPSNVAAECAADTDCMGPANTCITELPGGYCSLFCTSDEECPAGSACIQVQMGTALCLATCDPALTDQCRAGYGCSSAVGAPICLPGCEDSSDCAAGQECQVGGGFEGAGACFDPASNVGDTCTASEECPAGGFCQAGWPGGSCTLFGCDFETNDCPTGSECVVAGRFPMCVDDCATDGDCRTGYSCIPTLGFPDRLTCQPTFNPSALGVPCSQRRNPCYGGFCLSEGSYGYPDSYCVAIGCDPAAVVSDCPGDGVCYQTDSGVGVCFDGCTTTTDCRVGYTCRPSNSEDPSSPLGCMPGCESDAECANDGAVCNTGTGLCGDPFVATALGEPCASEEDCVGGRCMTEVDEGWPAGTCTYPGCRLSGTGMSATCPGTSVCVDDATGDPELGVCVEACPLGTECRAGYACVSGACRPQCAADSCGTGRTCDTASGLCITAP